MIGIGPRIFGIQYEKVAVQGFSQNVQDSVQERSQLGATYQRMTKKGEKMAWLTLADATGAIEAAVFPNAFARLVDDDGVLPLREGAFLVARGRLSQEEATGTKLFVDEATVLGSRASQLSALAVAIQEQPVEEWSAMGA